LSVGNKLEDVQLTGLTALRGWLMAAAYDLAHAGRIVVIIVHQVSLLPALHKLHQFLF